MLRSRPAGRALYLLSAIAAPAGALAQTAPQSPAAYLGYELGERFTPYAEVRAYSRALADASPLVHFARYGETVEGRELFRLVIASAENHGRLDEVLERNAELARNGTTEARAVEIARTNPAVVYLTYGIHGNEASSSEAAMWTAYDLATGASGLASVLDSLVVVIDPVANPDGRERYVAWYRSVVGATPNASPQSREHREPWPGGRYNHYLFDLNRDWAWLTQPETRARVEGWWRWNPQVHVDFHEMGPRSSYFFFPAAAPINPIYPDHILDWGKRFGEANARAFDANGWAYFTGESYDLLYPGYGDTWPSLTGAVGMTYEQAGSGSAGLRYARSAGDTLTLAMRATQHRAAAAATLQAAANGRTRLLLDYAEANRTAGIGEDDFLLVPGNDPTRLDRLIDHLLDQGIAVERADREIRLRAAPFPGFAERRDFPPGTALVRARQPRGRLAVTLLQPETELRGEYSYDISAWSLPYAYGVEAHRTRPGASEGWMPATRSAGGAVGMPSTRYGYFVPASEATVPGMMRFLDAGGSARVLAKPATFAGRAWPAGTWFVPFPQDPDLLAILEDAGAGAVAVPVAGGLAESGIDLGSESAAVMRLPRVALVGGEGIDPSSFGAHWFHIERQMGMPFDAIERRELARLDLARYDVIVVPSAQGPIGQEEIDSLRDWVDDGGRLVAVAGGAEAVAGIAEIELRERTDEEDDETALDRLLATREERERMEWSASIPGAILPVRLDAGHPVAWGAALDGTDELFVLHTEGRAFEPRYGAEVVAAFESDLEPIAGAVSDANLRRLERSAWLISRDIGAGRVILFADDPLFRLFWHASMPLYRNAILYGDR